MAWKRKATCIEINKNENGTKPQCLAISVKGEIWREAKIWEKVMLFVWLQI